LSKREASDAQAKRYSKTSASEAAFETQGELDGIGAELDLCIEEMPRISSVLETKAKNILISLPCCDEKSV
jgi:hypothetical protein